MEYHVHWSMKGSCFEIFGDGKFGLFWAKKLMEDVLTDHGKVLVLNISEMGNTVFFEPYWDEDDIYWLLKSSCFELFGDGKYGLSLSQNLDKRWWLPGLFELSMIFQDFGNMVFLCSKLRCNIDFLVF